MGTHTVSAASLFVYFGDRVAVLINFSKEEEFYAQYVYEE